MRPPVMKRECDGEELKNERGEVSGGPGSRGNEGTAKNFRCNAKDSHDFCKTQFRFVVVQGLRSIICTLLPSKALSTLMSPFRIALGLL